MKCIITGCALVLDTGWVAGDLFQTTGGDYVFNGNSVNGVTLVLTGPVGYERMITPEQHWERRGVYVMSPAEVYLNKAAQKYISDQADRYPDAP